jgi:hypothetical protein
MKITKVEKIWLLVVTIFYLLYNLPYVPAYNDPKGMFIHAAVTIIPIWVFVYIGLNKVYKVYKLKK